MITEKELCLIQTRFMNVSSSLMQANYKDYRRKLTKFLQYIEETPLLIERIKDAGECTLNLEEQVSNALKGGFINSVTDGRFDLGKSTDEEIRNIYAILCFIRDNEKAEVGHFFGYCIGTIGKFQDNVDGFNQDVVKVFVDDLQEYLVEEIETIKTSLPGSSISIQTSGNSITNLAIGNSSIVSNNTVNNGIDVELVLKLIGEIRKDSETLDQEVKEELWEALDMIKDDISKQQQTSSIWKVAKRTFERIKTGVDFALALGKLILIAEEVINR